MSLPLGLGAQSINLVEWEEKWDNSRDYTLEILEAIPEDQLGYQPTADQMTLREQLAHMAGNMFGLTQRYVGYSPEGYDAKANRSRLGDSTLTKAELKVVITEAYAFAATGVQSLSEKELNEKIEFFAGPKSRRQIAWLLHDHATHHRGQLIVYLRLIGIKPPRYRGW